MTNAKTYYKFWIAVIIASAIISLMGCAAPQPVTDPPLYQFGGLYQENDTIIGADTLKYWTKD